MQYAKPAFDNATIDPSNDQCIAPATVCYSCQRSDGLCPVLEASDGFVRCPKCRGSYGPVTASIRAALAKAEPHHAD